MKIFKKEKRQHLTFGGTTVETAGGEEPAFFESNVINEEDTPEKNDEGHIMTGIMISERATMSREKMKRIRIRQRFQKDRKHFFLYGGVALIFVFAIITAVLLYTNNDSEAAVTYETVDVTTTTIDRTLTAAGEITYADTETVSFSTSKTYHAICVEAEDAVVEGQNLAQYSDGTYLTADCNGVIAEINAPETGSTATSSNYITIYPTDEIILDITVPQDEISIVSAGDEADIIINADTSSVYEGVITYIGGAAKGSLSSSSLETTDESGGDTGSSGGSSTSSSSSSTSSSSSSSSYFEVTISLANDGNLKLGMSASCTIMLESKEDVLAVPVEAVYFDGDSRYVYIVGNDGSVAKQTVETGISDADYVEITSGLDGDETVRVEKIG